MMEIRYVLQSVLFLRCEPAQRGRSTQRNILKAQADGVRFLRAIRKAIRKGVSPRKGTFSNAMAAEKRPVPMRGLPPALVAIPLPASASGKKS
jgi:hypothetical protein